MSMITFSNACNIIKNKVSESNNSELIYSENSIEEFFTKIMLQNKMYLEQIFLLWMV